MKLAYESHDVLNLSLDLALRPGDVWQPVCHSNSIVLAILQRIRIFSEDSVVTYNSVRETAELVLDYSQRPQYFFVCC